jgi:type II secretory pathway component GspD/PulD (secretin)
MSGLKKETTVTQVDRVPVLGYIPLIDFFFSSRKEIKVRNDVVIFIIPTILEKTGVNNTPEDQHLLDKAMGQGGTKDKKM